jgi:hypothetical protein
MAVLRLDHKMGDRPGNGVDDHPGHIAADAIGTAHLGPDSEFRHVRHASLSA